MPKSFQVVKQKKKIKENPEFLRKLFFDKINFGVGVIKKKIKPIQIYYIFSKCLLFILIFAVLH
jgi:hypothetical protein